MSKPTRLDTTPKNKSYQMKNSKPSVDYGEPVEKMDIDKMKEIISSEIEHETEINYSFDDDFTFDIALIEEDNPILNIHVKNHKWDSGRLGLMEEDFHYPTRKIERYTKLEVPVYVCRSSKRIEETIEFANLWGNREFNELYKLFPNKISTINYIR